MKGFIAMEKEDLNKMAYNNLCYDIGCLNGEKKKFNVHMFWASVISIIGTNAVTAYNDFEDDLITRIIKMIPFLLSIKQIRNLINDIFEVKQSKYYLQLLCEKLEKKEIYINLEDLKKAAFKQSTFDKNYFLHDILLGNEMILSFKENGEVKYVDSEKNIEITDEVAECCLNDGYLLEYKKNKMRK